MKQVLILAAAIVISGPVAAQDSDLERPPAEMVEIVLPAGVELPDSAVLPGTPRAGLMFYKVAWFRSFRNPLIRDS